MYNNNVATTKARKDRRRWFRSCYCQSVYVSFISIIFVLSILYTTRWANDFYVNTVDFTSPYMDRKVTKKAMRDQHNYIVSKEALAISQKSLHNAVDTTPSSQYLNIVQDSTLESLENVRNDKTVVDPKLSVTTGFSTFYNITHDHVATIVLPRDAHSHTRKPFCLSWNINSDTWWTHHVDWMISVENNTHYCFEPMRENSAKTELFRKVYANQYYNDDLSGAGNITKETFCSNVKTVRMWSSGWGADFKNVANSLLNAMEEKRPMRMYVDIHSRRQHRRGWHYASFKNGSRPVCPLKSMECYFLNVTSCEPNTISVDGGDSARGLQVAYVSWLYEFATRPQTWLRKRVYDYYQENFAPIMEAPCTAMHVRRADVVLHKIPRRYHPIEEYMNESQYNLDRNLLLLTDDAYAIEEALHKYNNTRKYNWMYERRKRHHGAQGGWENPFPSGDPLHETIVILATIKAVRQCHTLVFSSSNLAEIFQAAVIDQHGEDAKLYNIDKGKNVYNKSHADTRAISKSYFEHQV